MTVNQGVQPVDPVQPASAAIVEPVVPVAQPAELPQETREKTREQFEKLLDSNRRLLEANESLKREMEARRQANQVFEPIQQIPPAQSQPKVNPQDFVEVDPKTGESYINEAKLRQKMDDINQRASRAEEAISSYIKVAEQKEIERQNNEAFGAYPELNPEGEKFDATFNKQVRGILFDSMYNVSDYGGRPLSFKEAADFVRAQYPKAPVVTPEAPKQNSELKEQVSAQPLSQPPGNRVTMNEDQELMVLREKTRRGDLDALARRLMATEHILPKDAQLAS